MCRLMLLCPLLLALCPLLLETVALGQIPKPQDAPQPVAAEQAASQFKLPEGLRMELVASEPLIHEPSGVCWDQQGRLFVCELHGYNLDGQIDIDELNKTGKLDKEVRRLFVPERIEEAAKAGTYGTVKQLVDTDGDGRMDKASVWADHIPACFGICPARDGIIVVCAPDIMFLADRDGDGKAEVQEVLFTGFATGVLDRRMGNPQWGLDDWIYVGRCHRDATITGPYLAQAVELPNSDFRIKSDGSAIEPISGAVSGLGFTFTESGDRFVSSVGWPAHLVTPLPWHALARNPYVVSPAMTVEVFPDRRVYPTSKPHPWRTRRAEDPGFAKFYTDRYGVAESAPSGYFTSCCAPLVYQDSVLPGLKGQLLACEPAQNLIHRSTIGRNHLRLELRRAKGEEKSEFLTTTDAWFHPIALSHGPDGAVWIADFYREIIEDYSAIPRYLQQQYGLTNGADRGRIWRLVAKQKTTAASFDMSRLSPKELVAEVASGLFWRRQTAQRLLTEGRMKEAAAGLKELARESNEPAVVITALHTLDGLGKVSPDLLVALLSHQDAGVRRCTLQVAEQYLNDRSQVLNAALSLADDHEPIVRLQLALSLGAASDERVMPVLVQLGRQDGADIWMSTAILSALAQRSGEMLTQLLREPKELGQGMAMLEPLCSAIAARREPSELSQVLVQIAATQDESLQLVCLNGIQSAFRESANVALDDTARQSVKSLEASHNAEVRSRGRALVRLLRLETPAERMGRLELARKQLQDVTLNADVRSAAVDELAAEEDVSVALDLLEGLPSATPVLRQSILDAILSRHDCIPALLDAIEAKTFPGTALSAVQRGLLLADKEPAIRSRAEKLLTTDDAATLEAFPLYSAALEKNRDVAHGFLVFQKTCGVCHQAHGIGVAVGPDLSSEFQRAEETIIKDILAPSQTISAGYMTYAVLTISGRVFTGLLASESPTSITLKQQEGKQQVILRNEIDELKVSPVSMMPADLIATLQPQDVADVIAWLRQPQDQIVLLDDNEHLALALNQGDGTAEFTTSDKFSGEASLRVNPPQRYSAQIEGWEFRIREKPDAGEYRYIRFAWKSPDASGVLIELADDGQWPPAEKPLRRYFAGKNLSGWQAVEVASSQPDEWTVVTRDLWKDFGDFTLTGIGPTAMGGPALFDRLELLRALETDSDQ
ncbi:MAG: c-type cytochrome [Pirellulaceae bacterium]|nr:c-type cytochrome [Pirellulaceae bacterium]